MMFFTESKMSNANLEPLFQYKVDSYYETR